MNSDIQNKINYIYTWHNRFINIAISNSTEKFKFDNKIYSIRNLICDKNGLYVKVTDYGRLCRFEIISFNLVWEGLIHQSMSKINKELAEIQLYKA